MKNALLTAYLSTAFKLLYNDIQKEANRVERPIPIWVLATYILHDMLWPVATILAFVYVVLRRYNLCK